MTLLYVGIACLANSLWPVFLLVPLLLVMLYGVVAREEESLERKFRGEYLRYNRQVRRWM